MQERFSSPVKVSAEDFHTVPAVLSPTTYHAFLFVGSITAAMKYHLAFSKEKDGVTDVSNIREPEEL